MEFGSRCRVMEGTGEWGSDTTLGYTRPGVKSGVSNQPTRYPLLQSHSFAADGAAVGIDFNTGLGGCKEGVGKERINVAASLYTECALMLCDKDNGCPHSTPGQGR